MSLNQPVLKVGAHNVAYDQPTGTTGSYVIQAVIVHTDSTIEDLTIDGEKIETTEAHPFYTQDRGWVDVGKLTVGDALYSPRSPAQIPVAGDGDDPTGPTYASFTAIAALLGTPPVRVSNAYYIRETGHNTPDVLIRWLQNRGDWISTMGFPISEAHWTTVKVGGVQKTVLVQLFERRVLTFTTDNSPQYQVEYGNIGLHYYRWRYGTPPTPSLFPTPVNADGCGAAQPHRDAGSSLQWTKTWSLSIWWNTGAGIVIWMSPTTTPRTTLRDGHAGRPNHGAIQPGHCNGVCPRCKTF